jgi:PAS domain S-box-containing protein
VLVAGDDGTIRFVNRHLERTFGYAHRELIGQSVDVLLPDALQEAHAVHRQGFVSSPEARPMGSCRALLGRRKEALFGVEVVQPLRRRGAGARPGQRCRRASAPGEGTAGAGGRSRFRPAGRCGISSFVNARGADREYSVGQRRFRAPSRRAVFQISASTPSSDARLVASASRSAVGCAGGRAFPWS